MKRLFNILFAVVLLALTACQYDEIWDKLHDHEQRIEQLEKQCRELNSNVEALQAILAAVQQNDYVTEIMKVMEDGVEVGYSITFSKSGTITIYHGADGSAGTNGATPQIGVRKAEDGSYYWTSDGEWITDENGDKIPAAYSDGGDGKYITPQFRIVDDVWYVSYDNGNSWRVVEILEEEEEPLISAISYDNQHLYITLPDGTTFTLLVGRYSKVYIAPDGSDDNDGSSIETPIATIAKAREILSPDGELVFLDGDYENIELNLSDFAILSAPGGNARLLYPRVKITEAISISGKISCADVPASLKSFTANIWQQDVPDASTEIKAVERFPVQKGRTHRLENTRIYNVLDFDASSADLSGYLATMESSELYMYYLDAANQKLYFSSPSSDFESYPIVIPSSKILKGTTERKVDISGLKFMYATLLTTGLNGNITNVFVGYTAAAGCIRWDYTYGMTFTECEVAAGKNDGFNGHWAGNVTCFNCWGHDCSDDGESCHEVCRIVQYGGLYEYNGNACTPATGGSAEYYNVTVCNNGDYPWVVDKAGTGFSAQGVAASIFCSNCLSINNTIGYRATGTDTYGIAVNCVSQNDVLAFSKMTQYNCTVINK